MKQGNAAVIVYGSSMSPYVRKVLAFAAEKGTELEVKPLGLGSDDPEFRETSPFGKIPGFRDGDFKISDSSAIVTYLEAIKPDPALIPAEPKARALAVYYDEFADTVLTACGVKLFFNRVVSPRFLKREGDLGAADKAEAEELPPILDYLQEQIPASGFLVEDRLTLADIAVASPFANLAHAGARWDEQRHGKLKAYVDAILGRPSFKAWIDREAAFLARSAA